MARLTSFSSQIFVFYLCIVCEPSVTLGFSFNCKECSPEVELIKALSKQVDNLESNNEKRIKDLRKYIASQTTNVKIPVYDGNKAQENGRTVILDAIENNKLMIEMDKNVLQLKEELSEIYRKMNAMETNIMGRVNELFQFLDQRSEDIKNNFINLNGVQQLGTDVILKAIESYNPLIEMQRMELTLKEQHGSLHQAIEDAKIDSQKKLETISKVHDSKFVTMMHNTTKFADSLKMTHDLTTASILLQKEPKECKQLPKYKNCYELYVAGFKTNGEYNIYMNNGNEGSKIKVYCDMTTSGGGWTVLLRRSAIFQPRINFNRNWTEYKSGFGELDEEHWIGLKNMYKLTSNAKYKLRMDLADFENEIRFAEYATVTVGNEDSKFVLNIGRYSGNAGDSFAFFNKMKFSTEDMDNDYSQKTHCAQYWKAPGWIKSCYDANIFGIARVATETNWMVGILWPKWRGNCYSLKELEMKIRPV